MNTIIKKVSHNFFSTFSKGLKSAALAELEQNCAKIISSSISSVNFSASLNQLSKILYNSRVLNKIVIILIENIKCIDYDSLYKIIKNYNWEKYFSTAQTIKINFSVFNSELSNTHYGALKIKDAVCDRFRELDNCRPSVNMDKPDVIIEARIINNFLEAGLSITNYPLFKRGYRKQTNAAPIKETLAAGIFHFIQSNDYLNIIDPMCGSGTIIIETAMRLLNIPAINCRHQSHIEKKLNLKLPDIKFQNHSNYKFIAADKTTEFLNITANNINSAGLSEIIHSVKQDFFNPVIDMTNSLIIFNAPYGERLHQNSDINEFYKKIGDAMKKYCNGSLVYILTSYGEHIKHIGLKASKKIELFNGKIECRLLEYKIF